MATEKAILAGGCFWGMQDLIRKLDGVVLTRVGYSGGDVPNATYRNHGTHAEAIEIVLDPERISYRDLLEFFFQVHDPTTTNRQGNDTGMSYRSAIFYPTTSSAASLRTRSPTSTPPASGPAKLSPRSSRPVRFGRPSPSTRTTSSATPTATPATSSGPGGDCRSGPRLQPTRQDGAASSPRLESVRERR
jgi:methionine-S-sulfoxide reductase